MFLPGCLLGLNMMIPEDTIELAGTVVRLHGRLSTSGPAIFVSKFVSNDFYYIIDNILNTISYYCHKWVLLTSTVGIDSF